MKKLGVLTVYTFLMVSLYTQNSIDFDIQGLDDDTVALLNYHGLVKEITIPDRMNFVSLSLEG
jgi:hypothetical protein